MPAAMKRQRAESKASCIKQRVKLVKQGLQASEGCDARVKKMLIGTLDCTVANVKDQRHAFNQRFVTFIGEALNAEHARLQQDKDAKEKAFTELMPAKSEREAAAEAAKAEAASAAEALTAANTAVKETTNKTKDATTALKEAQKAEKNGNAEIEKSENEKAKINAVREGSLQPLLDGNLEDSAKKTKAVMELGKQYQLDQSLLGTAEPVLLKATEERGQFDGTCLTQLTSAFQAVVDKIDEAINAGAPGKAERAAAVAEKEKEKADADAALNAEKEKAGAAREAKNTADAAAKAAAAAAADFMPDLKKAGDAQDKAAETLKEFAEGPLAAFGELKDLKDTDFEPEEPPAKVAATEAAPAEEAAPAA